MFELIPTTFSKLRDHRRAYLKTTVVPLDGMWETAFFPAAKHWVIQSDDEMIGYCAIDEANALVGFQVFSPDRAEAAFEYCLEALGLSEAFVSTAEPNYLSLCMDHQTKVTVNALMFEDAGREATQAAFPNGSEFRKVTQAEFNIAIDFGLHSIGDRRDWLEGYYAERIQKEELFGLWNGRELRAAGELRISPIQDGIADVGMVVSPEFRKLGIATLILKQLRYEGQQRGLRLICSTEERNIGARKAIHRAGFVSTQRILKIIF